MKISTSATIVAAILLPLLSQTAFSQLKTIAEAKQQEFGSVVTKVAGRVTVAGQFRNTAYLQDATGGIAVFNAAFRTGAQVGDSVEITDATLQEFQAASGQPGTGLSQLAGSNLKFTVIPVPRLEPQPRTMPMPSIGEGVEGQLVKIRSVSFVQSGAFQGETTYQIENNTGNRLDVRIDGATEIATNQLTIPTNRIDIVGVISQFRGSYQIIPRFATDLGMPAVTQDTVSRNRTLDVTTWNLYWFGSPDTTRGFFNKELQYRNIRRVMDTIDADLFALQEIAGEEYFRLLADTLGYGHITAPIAQEQKTAYLFKRSTIDTISSGLAVNGGAQAWGGGRYPFRLSFRAKIDGKVQNIVAFVIHGKATDSATAQNDLFRRKQDAETFHEFLNTFYRDSNVIVLGDFNDDVIGTVVDTTSPSPYSVFVNDSANWRVVTKPLSERGLASYVRGSNPSMIDHIIISNELVPQFHRAFIEEPRAFLSSYTATTSDHLPVTVRLFAGGEQGGVSVEEQDPLSGEISLRVTGSNGTAYMVELMQYTPGTVKVSLVNSIGHEVRVFAEGYSGPQLRWVTIDGNEFSSGAYFIRVVKDGRALVYPICIAK